MDSSHGQVIRMDLILSYWLFAWFILYALGIVEANPKLILMIGFVVNMMMLAIKVVKRSRTVIPFIIINTIIKVIPLVMLMHTEAITATNIEATVIVLLLFLIWLVINAETFVESIKNKARPPFEHWWVTNIGVDQE
jgi:hypothetical protein